MKIEEAIVYVIMERNGGMTTNQIAEAINHQGLYQRKDRQLVTSRCMQLSVAFLRCSQKRPAELC